MYFGWPSLCLNVRDLEASAGFYTALGMQMLPDASDEGRRVVLRSGGLRLGLFRGIETNCLNFRGADVLAAHEALKQRFPDLAGAPERYHPNPSNRAGAAGVSWLTEDPEGNAVFFDTNEMEEGDAHKRARIREILADAEHALASIDATECVEVLRRELIDRFDPSG